MNANGSTADPYRYREVPWGPGNRDFKPFASPRIKPGERTFTLMIAGQSLAANAGSGFPYTPAGYVSNLSVLDGGMYVASDPLNGAAGPGTGWQVRWADKMLATGEYDRIILVPLAVGGTSVTEWAPGGILDRHIAAAVAHCARLNIPIDALAWQQGESDHALSQSAYAAYLLAAINASRAAGLTCPWYIGKSTWINGITSDNVRNAGTSLIDGTTIKAGADTDALGFAYRFDGTHMNAAGQDASAELWKAAILAT